MYDEFDEIRPYHDEELRRGTSRSVRGADSRSSFQASGFRGLSQCAF